ncbi:MAG: hypothetical protein JWN48_4975 [Myxococcaceae bacterium]|nr:hypothetical protein [Myxococcaceae bacterium]
MNVQRREFVDWVRGVAVVAMVVWHTADGWLLPAVRVGQGWAVLRFVGGLAAPSFIFLAGAAVALAARPGRTHAQPLIVGVARGLEIMLVGYALRFQTWMIDAGAAMHLYLVRSWLPLGIGYALLFVSLRSLGNDASRARRFAIVGAVLVLVGLAQVPWLAPGRLPRLLQIDVLQAIGAALALLALAERGFGLLQRPVLTIAIGAAVALLTEPVWSVLPGVLPVPLAAYLGKFEPAAGAPPPALFPLFPWLAYACIGAAFGTKLRTSGAASERVVVGAGIGGALLSLCTSEAHHAVQTLITVAPWTVHPLRVAFRVGLVLVLLLLGWLWAERERGRVLVSYGRASLRVYWAHLLIAYGSLGHPWQKQLFMGQWATRLSLLLMFMWLLTRIGGAPVPLKAPAST